MFREVADKLRKKSDMKEDKKEDEEEKKGGDAEESLDRKMESEQALSMDLIVFNCLE